MGKLSVSSCYEMKAPKGRGIAENLWINSTSRVIFEHGNLCTRGWLWMMSIGEEYSAKKEKEEKQEKKGRISQSSTFTLWKSPSFIEFDFGPGGLSWVMTELLRMKW